MNRKQKKLLIRIIITAALIVILSLISLPEMPDLILYIAAYIIIGYDILKKSVRGILNGHPFDENFLMSVASIGAFVLAIYEKSGEYNESVFVMLFYQTGELFQSIAIGKSRRSITKLMDIRPDHANIEESGKLIKINPAEVLPGSIIVVQPGEKIPIDGIVTDGSSSLNTSALTGESLPKDVSCGDSVISGCVNMTGILKIKTTKEFGESTVSKILDLVENAGMKKSRSEEFISRFARIYTPAVIFAAIAVAFIPHAVRYMILGLSSDFSVWIYRALTFLVISCPCALVISIPLSFFAGIGGAGREGILIKGSTYLELLSKVRTVVFDKTGTLTNGSFKVTEINNIGIEKDKLLEYAAYIECASSHPISKSLLQKYGKDIDRSRISDIKEISGKGIYGKVDNIPVAAGNSKLLDMLGTIYPKISESAAHILVAVNGRYAGYIEISDTEKPTAKEAVSQLKKAKIEKTIMLTGDGEAAAKKVASSLHIDEYFCNLLPSDKVNIMEKIIKEKSSENKKSAFVGDGINDAPVLSMADIGIAMGAMGSDAAIEAADIVLMDDDPLKISKAIKISRKCIRIVYQNIIFALSIKFLFLILGALGISDMWFAIFADVGVMIIAVLNSIRALNVHKL